MKTKNKVMVLVEIAIVLCSVLLVALPVIATDQSQEMLSASEVTATSEDDYVLGIYGNANEDDTIDMRDLTYVKLIFFGKKPETELADAKYDGKINPLDFIQIKLIIVGKEKELTANFPAYPFVAAQIVTVHMPVERIVVVMPPATEVLRSLNAADKIVGVGTHMRDDPGFFPELSKLPHIGSFMGPGLDYEAILNLRPDLFLAFTDVPQRLDERKKKLPGVTVICLSLNVPWGFGERVRLLGYILDREEEAVEEAVEYINWHEGWMNKIKSRTEGVSQDEKPRVFHWSPFKPGGDDRTITKRSRIQWMYDIAGGINIAADLEGRWVTVDPEWVIEQNPDIIVAWATPCGYGVDDPSEMAAAREDILNRPELANLNAVKNSRVYIMDSDMQNSGGGCCLIGIAYMARLFHPDLFEDLDPQVIHQEYIDLFQHIDFNVYEHGVFVYPPLES